MHYKDFFEKANSISFFSYCGAIYRHNFAKIYEKEDGFYEKICYMYIDEMDNEIEIVNYTESYKVLKFKNKEYFISQIDKKVLELVKYYAIEEKMNLYKKSYKYDYFIKYLMLL